MEYYHGHHFTLYQDNAFAKLKELEEKSVHLIFAEPPFILNADGDVCTPEEALAMKSGALQIQSLDDRHRFNRIFIRLCKRVLSDDGTIWVSGTLNNLFSLGLALQQEGFRILNTITWQKTNPPPNLSCRFFVHSTEMLLWARKDIRTAKHTFHYDYMKEHSDGNEDKDVWTSPITPKLEKRQGKHPTQKPLWLMEKVLLCSTNEDDTVLDPFCGSGSMALESYKHHRNFIGIESEERFLALTKRRLEEFQLNDYEQLSWL